MYDHITQTHLTQLLKLEGSLFLSLYMPMARSFPDQEQNPVRYRNLLRKLRERAEAHGDAVDPALLEPFEALVHDDDLWRSPRNGLAVIGGEGVFKVFSLHQTVEECVCIDHQPYLKPLLQISQSAGSFQVLCVTRDAVRLLKGDQNLLEEVELHPEGRWIPKGFTEATTSEPSFRSSSSTEQAVSTEVNSGGGLHVDFR